MSAKILTSWKAMSSQPLRWFAINGIFANFSNGLTYLTMAWILLSTHNSISSLAALMICFWAPTVLLGPLCGVIADRYSRRAILILSTTLRGLLLVGAPLLIHRELSSMEIYSMAVLLSILGNLYGPASYTYIREITPAKQMFHANAIVAMSYEIGNIVGMGSAGLLLALNSSRISIAISGVLFLIATVCLLMMKPEKIENQEALPIPARENFWQSLRSGIRYLAGHKNLCVLYCVQLILMVIFLTTPIILAPFAKNILNATSSQFGIIQACLSVGVILGGILAPTLAEIWKFKTVILTKTTALVALLLLFGLNSHIWIAYIIAFLLGVTLASWTLIITKAQLHTHVEFLSRVQAAFNSLAAVFILLVYLLLNTAGDLAPLAWLYAGQALFLAGGVILLWKNRKIL